MPLYFGLEMSELEVSFTAIKGIDQKKILFYNTVRLSHDKIQKKYIVSSRST